MRSEAVAEFKADARAGAPAGRSSAGAPRPDAAVRFVVATANRTAGAVICGLLDSAGRATRWIARRRAEAELSSGDLSCCDILLIEVVDPEAAKTVMAARGSEGPTLIAIADGRPELRAACENAGFDGCVNAPVDPAALLELTSAFATRVEEGDFDEPSKGKAGDPSSGIIDMRAIEDLSGLGGTDFVHDIIDQFIEDAASLLRALHEASRAGDASTFRDQAHALRSCAANVGASSVYAKCLALRGIGTLELADAGASHVARLEAEVSQAREILRSYLARR